MRIFFTIISVFFFLPVFSQQPGLEWVRNIGGPGTDVGTAVATDLNGNVFMCGRFSGTADLDPESTSFLVTSNGDTDMCVTKLDADGHLLWAKVTGGTGFDQFSDVVTDAEGNCILSGSFTGTIQPDPNDELSSLTATGAQETLVLKLDPDGNTLWYHHTESSNYTEAEGLAVDADNSIYLAGSYAGTTQFNPISIVIEEVGIMNTTMTSEGENDVFLFKLLADGSFDWVQTAGSTSYDAAKDIAIDNQNNINVIGRFRSTIDFDLNGIGQTSTSSGLNDGFVWQVNSQGMYQWHTTFGGTGFDEVWAVATDADGHILTFGYFSGTADLDPGAGDQSFVSNGSDDLFIQKFSSEGDLLWVKVFGGGELENSYDIASDADGNIVLTGDFFDTVDFNPGAGTNELTSAGNNDIYFMQLNPDGNFDWAFRIGATFSQAGYSVAVGNDGSIYGTGTFSNVVDFNPGTGTVEIAAQDFNIYLVKFGSECLLPELTSVTTDPTVCEGQIISANISGTLNGSGQWQLLTGGCNGQVIASSTSNTIVFSPEADQSYFIRTNGGCITSDQDVCTEIELNVAQSTETFTSAVFCEGSTVTFPDGSTALITESMSQTSVLTNEAGCDSIITTYIDVPFLPEEIDIQVNGTTIEVINFPSKSGIDLQWIDCNNKNSPIEGEIGLTFNIPGPGSYAVVYSDQGCSKMTDCIVITNVNEVSSENLSLYPNPAEDGFYIKQLTDAFVSVRIYNANGQLLISEPKHPANEMVMFTVDMAAGLYVVEVTSHSRASRFRMMKK